ncbi:MAG: ATP-binding cassette domain-containing protein [Clostridiales bacterium]|nr:ATP-binding cassette domain-containing protein [Clostridiales bacterium]
MIEIRDLVKVYGDKTAVDGISFTVNKGEVLGFLGPNGAGKSTTMNIITGYLSSTSGSVKVNGHDILEEPAEAKKCIGYLPEIPPLYPDMTVLEYLKFICDLKGVAKEGRKEMLASILAMVRITDVAERLIANLSKGYKQRVGIAQALIGNPEILILDEPTVGLDPNQIIEIRKMIKHLAKDRTIILSSHILSEVQAVCDRVVIINNGKLVAIDTINDLSNKINGTSKLIMCFKGPAEDVIRNLTNVAGVDSVELVASEDDIHKIEINSENDDDGIDIRTRLFNSMAMAGWPVLEFRSKELSLEEIFLKLTGEK